MTKLYLTLLLTLTLAPLVHAEGVEDKPYGCDWFPMVHVEQRVTMVVDYLINRLVVSYDTNGDNVFDVQHEYDIEGYGSTPHQARQSLTHDTPHYIMIDQNYDGYPDYRLEDSIGDGKCSSYRAIWTRKEQNQPQEGV